MPAVAQPWDGWRVAMAGSPARGKSGDETHWHPSGALLLDALLQALAVAEPERAFALVELRLSVPRFSRCGPLASRLTLSLSDKASITLALRGEHDHEWRDVLSAVPLECASPDVDQLELSPADLGRAEAGLVAAALEGQRDGRYGNYRFPLRSDAARRRLLLAETLALFQGAHAAPVVGFARVQVLDDLPEHIAVRVSGAELGRLQSLYAVDEDGCVVALFRRAAVAGGRDQSKLALADEPAASLLVARWEDFPDRAGGTEKRRVAASASWWGRHVAPGFGILGARAGRPRDALGGRPGPLGVAGRGCARSRPVRPARCPAAVTATSSVSLTFCSPWGGRWRRARRVSRSGSCIRQPGVPMPPQPGGSGYCMGRRGRWRWNNPPGGVGWSSSTRPTVAACIASLACLSACPGTIT